MPPTAIVEHRLAGRARFRLRGRRGDAGYFERVASRLRTHADVRGVHANPRTGGLLVVHRGDLTAIIEHAAGEGLFHIRDALPPLSGRHIPAESRSLELAGVGNLGGGALVGLCLYQVARGQIAGSASESFSLAYATHARLGRPVLALGFAGLGIYRLVRGPRLGSAASLLFYGLSARGNGARSGAGRQAV